MQALKLPSLKTGPEALKIPSRKTGPELRRTSSFDKTWEDTLAESVANELADERSRQKSKDPKLTRTEETRLKDVKSQEEKKSHPQKVWEFRNVKICQVGLLYTRYT